MKMSEDLQILRPTIFASVPRIFNRYYSKIKESFAALSSEKKPILDEAFKEKLQIMRSYPD